MTDNFRNFFLLLFFLLGFICLSFFRFTLLSFFILLLLLIFLFLSSSLYETAVVCRVKKKWISTYFKTFIVTKDDVSDYTKI